MIRNVRSPEVGRDEGPDTSSDYEPRTYRGSDLEELLPKIREELGADAIVVRQREGLDGGVGGFFQKRCVEVVARRATPSVDMYDSVGAVVPEPQAGEPAPQPAPEPRAPAIEEIMRVASPFIEQLQAAEAKVQPLEPPMYVPESFTRAEPAEAELEAGVGAEHEPTPAPAQRTGAAANHERTLVAAGIAPQLATDIIDATISHVVPFGPTRALKRLVRENLARRIPLAPPIAAGGRALAFVGAGGSGKTLCVARLATAYAKHSDLDVSVMSLTTPERGVALREQLHPVGVDVLDARSTGAHLATGDGVLTVLDTPAVSPADSAKVEALAEELERLGDLEVHVAVPATLSAAAVRSLLDGLAPLRPAAIVLTHLDEVGHAGPVIDEAVARGIAISYTSDGSAEDGFAPADPAALAARVLA